MKMTECPSCHEKLQVNDSKWITFCENCGTRFVVTDYSDYTDLEFHTDDYIIQPEHSEITLSWKELLTSANQLIDSNDNAFLGWYYKGLYYADRESLDRAVTCWTGALRESKDDCITDRMYRNIVMILIKVKFRHDSKKYPDKYLQYPSLKSLNMVMRSIEPGFGEYGLIDDLLYAACMISATKLTHINICILIDMLGNLTGEVLKSYADFRLLHRVLNTATDIERQCISKMYGREENRLMTSEDILDAMRNDPRCNNGLLGDNWEKAGLAITFDHMLLERMDRYPELLDGDRSRAISDYYRNNVDYTPMQKYDLAMIIVHKGLNHVEYLKKEGGGDLPEMSTAVIDSLVMPAMNESYVPKYATDEKIEQPKKKKGLFGFLKKERR